MRLARLVARNILRNHSKLPLREAWALLQTGNPRKHVAIDAAERLQELRFERAVAEKKRAAL